MKKTKYGCPNCKVNSKTLFEECKVTKQVIEGKVECDFGYETCPHYKAKRGDTQAQGCD